MELSQHGLLEELLTPRRDSRTTSSNGGSLLQLMKTLALNVLSTIISPTLLLRRIHGAGDGFFDSIFPAAHEDYPSMVDDEDQFGLLSTDHQQHSLEEIKTKSKRLEGQPSKNLMAERRRRKRLNDRLSMLRSIVPKISKMDRTSILGDTIDYMKELLERIKKMQEEETKVGFNHLSLMNNMKELKPNEMMVRSSPKFEVKRSETDTRIDIRCATKPGLLLSTVNTLEALGLEIQVCDKLFQ
ncbi:Transcription factor bHLH61 [Hibiscus syriacus]|uniref:Transcription factor bHLH61 n=1 Tax=Hibiscus syriacus TaxID=106335 RepID=A0A6A3AVZ9_HIBSY|nr:Transcription factor bHLH61 [Hibiscus syriacus]